MNYALLILGALLDLKRFNTLDELKDAILAVKRRDKRFIVLSYHHGVGEWQQLEVME